MLRVYLETTIPSYLAAKPSRDLVTAARQEMTHDWWDNYRQSHDVYTSALVLKECNRGDHAIAQRRVAAMQELVVLQVNPAANAVAKHLLEIGIVPAKAAEDAGHVGIATVHNIDVLLTWNCTHLANATILRQLNRAVRELGYEPPLICTPEEMLGEK